MMGYRYVIEAVKHSDSAARGTAVSVETVLNNKGVAPFYQDWKLEYSLADADGTIVYKERQDTDLRTLLPGRHVLDHQLDLPSTLAAGSYKLLIAVIDPATDSPGMELAIDGERPDGRYEVGSLTVTSSSGSTGSGNSSAPAADDSKVQRLGNPVLTDGKLAVTLLAGKEKIEVPLQASALAGNPSIVVSDGKVSWELSGSLLSKAKELAGSGTAWLSITVKSGLDLASYAVKDNATAHGVGQAQAISFGLAVTAAAGEKTLDFAASPVNVSLKPDSTDVNAVNLYGIQNERLKAASASFRNGLLTAQITDPGTYQWLQYEKVYSDITTGHWAASAIEALAAKQVMQGIDADRFAPGRSITRAELAAILARMPGLGIGSGEGAELPFKDVPASAWYADELKEVLESGLMNGYGDTFKPDAAITREELAALAARAGAKVSGGTGSETAQTDGDYRDAAEISSWAVDSVSMAKQLGLMIGDADGRFRPQEGVSRAEAAVIVFRLIEMLLK